MPHWQVVNINQPAECIKWLMTSFISSRQGAFKIVVLYCSSRSAVHYWISPWSSSHLLEYVHTFFVLFTWSILRNILLQGQVVLKDLRWVVCRNSCKDSRCFVCLSAVSYFASYVCQSAKLRTCFCSNSLVRFCQWEPTEWCSPFVTCNLFC